MATEPPPKSGYKGPKKKKGRSIGYGKKKRSRTFDQWRDAQADNPALPDERMVEAELEPAPEPIVIAATAATTLPPAPKKMKVHHPDGWKTNRKVKALEKKMDKAVKKHACEHAMVVAKLKMEKQRRVSAEQKLERRSEAVTKARAELGSEKRKRVAAENKVRY